MRVKRNYKYTGVDGMATEGGGLELVRDGKKVGQSGQGTYIIQELDGEFFWFQILQFSSSELKVKTKFGQTFVFEKV